MLERAGILQSAFSDPAICRPFFTAGSEGLSLFGVELSPYFPYLRRNFPTAMTEFGFIDAIRSLCADLPRNGFEGIGDDCAVLPVGGGESLVFTADLLNEGVHFLRAAASPEEIGHKALAVNLSDVAAMGARPVATLLSLALPADLGDAWADRFMQGYHALAARFGVALVGGDTTRSAGGITINVTAIGRADDRCLKRRSAARPGDALLVAGALGASGAGLQDILRGRCDTSLAALHRNPAPQVEEGVWLGARPEVHAVMDLSDGLASDVRHIMEESRVGAALELERIPVADGADLRTAACGGEDYKLLLSADAASVGALVDDFRARFGEPLVVVGAVEPGDRLRWLRDGREVPLDWTGFTHY